MPRQARVIAINQAHHVYQRPQPKRVIFNTDKDYEVYLGLLTEYAKKFKVDVLAYCLLKKHIHLVLKPKTKTGLAQLMGRVQFHYAAYYNNKRKAPVDLWRNRYQSCPVDTKKVWSVVHFVETLPVAEKLVTTPSKYLFSSAKAHQKWKDTLGLLCLNAWPGKRNQKKLTDLTKKVIDAEVADYIRMTTQTGRPWGTDLFVTGLEKTLKRTLKSRAVGRPRKD